MGNNDNNRIGFIIKIKIMNGIRLLIINIIGYNLYDYDFIINNRCGYDVDCLNGQIFSFKL